MVGQAACRYGGGRAAADSRGRVALFVARLSGDLCGELVEVGVVGV